MSLAVDGGSQSGCSQNWYWQIFSRPLSSDCKYAFSVGDRAFLVV